MDIDSILIIDDEPEVCILLTNFLLKQNKKVEYSTSLKEGIEKFKETKPSLLILDHNLTDGNGIENISLFKSFNNTSIIIIISAMSDLRNNALEKGASYFLEKPISFSTLKSIMEK